MLSKSIKKLVIILLGDSMKYRKISTITYNEKKFFVFLDDQHKYAFLETRDNKLYYPDLKDVLNLAMIFNYEEKNIFKFKRDKKKKRKYKFRAGVLVAGTILMLSPKFISNLCSTYNIEPNTLVNMFSVENEEEVKQENTSTDEDINQEKNTNVEDLLQDLEEPSYEIEYRYDDRTIRSNYFYEDKENNEIIIYNNIALDKYFGYKDVSLEQIIAAINNNDKIDDKYKPSIIDFVYTMDDYYTNIDWRVFYENIKDMQIKVSTHGTLDDETLAVYSAEYNTMLVKDNLDLSEGTLDSLIFRHELGHGCTEGKFQKSGNTIVCQFANNVFGKYTEEAMTVVFTTRPFLDRYSDELKENMGYPRTANIYTAITSCLDNYEPSEMTCANIDFFIDAIDAKTSYDAVEMVTLIELCSTEFYTGQISVSMEDKNTLSSFIGDLWISNHLSSESTLSEANASKNELLDVINRGFSGQNMIQNNILNSKFNDYIDVNNLEANISNTL